MTKKHTKRALLTSALVMILCLSMLVGTTFAWFTDSAASGSNVIKSGNLDIDVQYTLDGDTWTALDGASDLFAKGLWEPGHTEVVVLRITNNGSLALKYNANMNIVSETVGKTKSGNNIVLSNILTVSTCTQEYTDSNGVIASGADIFPAMAFNGEGGVDGWIGYQTTSTLSAGNLLKTDKQLLPKQSDYVAIKVDMAETVGNEANHDGINIPSIDFGVNVVAAQYTYENDTFGNQYDKDAEYPVYKNIVISENSSEAVVIAANEIVELDMTNAVVSNSVTNYGEATVTGGTIDVDATGFENHGDATLNGVDIEAGTPGTQAYGYAVNVYAGSNTVLTEVDVSSANGAIGVTGGAELTFNSGSVEVASESTAGRYLFYVVDEGSVVTINGGTFDFNKTQNQKRAYAYVGSGATLYITGGTFGTASSRSGYTAGILGDGTVIITGGTFGFDPSAWVADGYQAVLNGSTWTVSPLSA